MEEIWKEIPWDCGNYSVSNMGNVRSNDRVASDGRRLRGRVLKTYKIKPRGYHTVILMENGVKAHYLVHRIVYCVFNNLDIRVKLDIDHENNDPDDNRLSNLSAMTRSENIKKSNVARLDPWYIVPRYDGSNDAFREGNEKRIVQLIDDEVINVFESIVEAERVTGISKHNISRCLRGLFRTSGGFTWKYVI